MGADIIALLNQASTLTYCNLEILLLRQSILIGKSSSDDCTLFFGGYGRFTGGTEKFVVVGYGTVIFLLFLEVVLFQIFRWYITLGR